MECNAIYYIVEHTELTDSTKYMKVWERQEVHLFQKNAIIAQAGYVGAEDDPQNLRVG